jgi:BspA type Leucine rich repeat region (6 copies)
VTLPYYALASYTNYILFGLDTSSFAGLFKEIRFTANPAPPPGLAINGAYLDDIQFSSAPMQNQMIYVTNNGAITITKFTGPGGDVVIPSTINDLPVTGIGDAAFYESLNLASVTIPESVTNIGSQAFYSCLTLTSVRHPHEHYEYFGFNL